MEIQSIEATVPPISSTNIFVTCSEKIAPTWIDIPEDVAPHFVVTDVKVGMNSQLVSTGCVPATFFTKRARRKDLLLDLLPSDLNFILSVTNITGSDQKFSFVLHGAPVPADHRRSLRDSALEAVLGLGLTLVKPGEHATINVEPQLVFSPRRLHLPPDVLESFEVHELVKLPMLGALPSSRVSSHYLKTDRLRQNGIIDLWPDPRTRPSQYLSLMVTNHAGRTLGFRGALAGQVHH